MAFLPVFWHSLLLPDLVYEVWMPAFRALGGMPSGPAALPDFSDFMTLMISYLVGGLVLIARSSVDGGISNGTDGASLLSVLLKCSAHLVLWSSSLEMVLPFLSLTGRLGLMFFLFCFFFFQRGSS